MLLKAFSNRENDPAPSSASFVTSTLNSIKPMRLPLGLLAMAILWVACTSMGIVLVESVTVNPTKPAQIEPHEAVAVLPLLGLESSSTAGAVRCVSDAIQKNFPKTRIISKDEFQRAVFPDLLSEELQALEYLPLPTDDPEFLKRIAPFGLRYLIIVEARTVQKVDELIIETHKGWEVVALGVKWDRRSTAEAEVFDVKERRSIGQFRASAWGNPWVACYGFFFFCAPVGLPTFTESRLCSELGDAAAKFFSGEAASETSREAKELDGGIDAYLEVFYYED